ncbi:MAG: YeiH family protein [Chakrabartia sp.]
MSKQKAVPAVADLYGDLYEPAAAAKIGMRDYIPGLVVTGVAALAAAYLAEHYGAPLMLMGLLIGLAFNFANADTRLHPGLNFASRSLLRWGIVLVGAQITFAQIASLGVPSFIAIAVILALVTVTGLGVARLFGLPWALGLLAGGSVAICGASAALALSTLLGEKRTSQAQLTLVLVCVSAASAFAMSTYPILAGSLGLSDRQAGFLIGASIHDVAQALGAGYSFSNEAGQTAAIVKLTRVALLAPTLAVIALILSRQGAGKAGPITVPWFVMGFLAVAAVNSFMPLPPAVVDVSRKGASALLLLAVVATGIKSPMQLLLQQGWRSSMPVVGATLVSFLLSLAAAIVLA